MSGKKYICKITIKDKLSKINKTKAALQITKTKTAPTIQLKVTGKKAKWTSSNKTVATVSKTGKVTAKKKGSATITAKIGKRKLTCKVTVTDNRTPAPTPITDTCQHEWADIHAVINGHDFVGTGGAWKVVYHEGLDGCAYSKVGNFTEFSGCGRCGIIYKNGKIYTNIMSLQGMQKLLGTFTGCSHSRANLLCQPNNDECPMPTGYWFVATKQCTKCGAYSDGEVVGVKTYEEFVAGK